MSMRGLTPIALLPSVRLAADNNGAGVDIRDYDGEALVLLNSSATEGAGQTADFKLQESDDNSAWSDVPVAKLAGGAFTQVTNAAASFQKRGISLGERKRYLRVVTDVTGAGATVTVGAVLVAKPQRG